VLLAITNIVFAYSQPVHRLPPGVRVTQVGNHCTMSSPAVAKQRFQTLWIPQPRYSAVQPIRRWSRGRNRMPCMDQVHVTCVWWIADYRKDFFDVWGCWYIATAYYLAAFKLPLFGDRNTALAKTKEARAVIGQWNECSNFTVSFIFENYTIFRAFYDNWR
jgi:hypothetical protein